MPAMSGGVIILIRWQAVEVNKPFDFVGPCHRREVSSWHRPTAPDSRQFGTRSDFLNSTHTRLHTNTIDTQLNSPEAQRQSMAPQLPPKPAVIIALLLEKQTI